MAKDETTKPKITYYVGTISLTVWENKNKDNDKFDSIKVNKSYKDKDGNWKEGGSLNAQDVANLRACCDKYLSENVVLTRE